MNSIIKKLIIDAINKNLKLHMNRGFIIKFIDNYLQFKNIKYDIDRVYIDIVDIENHIDIVKKYIIRTVKKGIIYLECVLPYRILSILIVSRLVECTTRNLKSFPVDNSLY